MLKVFLHIFIFTWLSVSCFGSEAHNFGSLKPCPIIAQSSGASATTNGGELKTFALTAEDLKSAVAKSVLSIQNRPFKPQAERLVDFGVSKENLLERNMIGGPFRNYKDYQDRCLSRVPTEVRTYVIAGLSNVRIVLPETYAKKLDRRQGGEKHAIAHSAGESAVAGASAAAGEFMVLPLDNLQNRVSPQDMPQLIEQMPDPRYFKRIFISDQANPEDDWVTQIYYPKGFVSATAMTEGVLNLYKTNLNNHLRRDVMHEWGHELRYKFWDDPVRERFHDACQVETQWNPRAYAARGDSEQWAVLGERLIGTNTDDFMEACEKAPIRTSLWMVALRKCLAEVPANCRSIDHTSYVERLQYASKEARGKAISQLRYLSTEGKTQSLREQANRVLVYLEAN